MMWLWLVLLWSTLACGAGVWLGTAMRIADSHDAVRDEVEAWVDRELAGL